MSRQRAADEAKLEAYLDNLLSPHEAKEFERRLRDDATLREQLLLQREIDASLVRAFPAAAADAETIEIVRRAAEHPVTANAAAPAQRWKVIVAAIAAGMSCVLVGWQLFHGDVVVDQGPAYMRLSLEQIYANSVASGFQPTWLCEDDRQFVETFEQRQGRGLLLSELPANMEMAGLAYLGGVTSETTTLMMWVDKRPVMVIVERLERDQAQAAPSADSGLNLFRREKWGLVLYELSPFGKSRVIDLLVPASSSDIPAEDRGGT